MRMFNWLKLRKTEDKHDMLTLACINDWIQVIKDAREQENYEAADIGRAYLKIHGIAVSYGKDGSVSWSIDHSWPVWIASLQTMGSKISALNGSATYDFILKVLAQRNALGITEREQKLLRLVMYSLTGITTSLNQVEDICKNGASS